MVTCEASFIRRESSRPFAFLDIGDGRGHSERCSIIEVSCVICHLSSAIQPASVTARSGLSPAASLGEDEGSQSRGTRCEGNAQLALRRYRLSLPQLCLPTSGSHSPARPASPHSTLRRRARPLRLAGFRFNNAQSCLLPDLRPPNRTHGGCGPEDSRPATQVAPGPCLHCCPTHAPPLYSGTYQGKKRVGDCLHPQRTNKAWMPTSETQE